MVLGTRSSVHDFGDGINKLADSTRESRRLEIPWKASD
jgi:hypothetical protein